MFILLFQLPEAAFILGQRLATTGQVFLVRVSPTLTSAPFPQDPVVTLTHQDNSGHLKVSWHPSFYLQPYRLFYFLSKFIYFTSGLQSPLCPSPSPILIPQLLSLVYVTTYSQVLGTRVIQNGSYSAYHTLQFYFETKQDITF